MADQAGVGRNIFLPDVPELAPIDPDASILDMAQLLRETIVNIFDYLNAEHDAAIAAYDQVTKRLNEYLVESQWTETIKTQITSNQNNYILGDGVVLKISSDAARSITGFEQEISDGHHKLLINSGSFPITVVHQSASSSAANRVITITGLDVTLAANGIFEMWHDPTTNRWRHIRSSSDSGTSTALYLVCPVIMGTMAAGITLFVHPVTDAMTIPAGATGSQGKILTAATALSTFTMNKNGASFGTMQFAAAATVATFTVASDTIFAAGDYITVTAPNPADLTLADLGFSLRGVR